MELVLYFLAIGAFAGLLAGLLGVGGGLVIVPALAWIYHAKHFPDELIMHLAVGTSLATIVVTAVSSTWAHHRRDAVLWSVFWQLVPGIVAGALLSAAVADAVPSDWLRIVFAVFVLLVAVQMALAVRPRSRRALPGKFGQSLAGLVIGFVSAIVGIGGGTLTVPYLIRHQVLPVSAVATSAACGLPIALSGSIGFVIAGWGTTDLPPWSSGYVYWPAFFGIVIASAVVAPLGARLAHRIPGETLKRVFSGFLAMVAIRMFFL